MGIKAPEENRTRGHFVIKLPIIVEIEINDDNYEESNVLFLLLIFVSGW